jgi:hypothetical protein
MGRDALRTLSKSDVIGARAVAALLRRAVALPDLGIGLECSARTNPTANGVGVALVFPPRRSLQPLLRTSRMSFNLPQHFRRAKLFPETFSEILAEAGDSPGQI